MPWNENMIIAVWSKGKIIPNFDPSKYRQDQCGAWIKFTDYGNRSSDYGWEIDHISPGGPDILSNLRPLQWQNNLSKSDGRLKCKVTSDGNKNISV
jgi:hypothetical protein